MEKLAADMEIEDPQYIFYWYHSHLKPHLEKQIEYVKALKTGGPTSQHASHFTPLNKQLQISPDIVDVAEDVRSLQQLKFYKLLIFRMIEATNLALSKAAFKGRVYLKKNFYSMLHAYWEQEIHPGIEKAKEEQAAADEAEATEVEEGEEMEEEEGEESPAGEVEGEEGDDEDYSSSMPSPPRQEIL
jgi:hypothetical protein